jgi:hypothetical protein
MINLSTKDMNYGPRIISTIHFEPSKEEHLSTKNKSAENSCQPQSALCLEVHCNITVKLAVSGPVTQIPITGPHTNLSKSGNTARVTLTSQ